MIVGTGIDIVEVERVKALKDKWQDRFLNKLFTDQELAYANGKKFSAQHLAARIAIKEAVIKAVSDDDKKTLGNWKDIEVANDKSGRPFVNLYGVFAQYKKERKISQVIIGASHTHKYAVASAILEK